MKIFNFLMLAVLLSASSAQAQSLKLCLNKSSQQIAVKATCATTETLLSGKNLTVGSASATATPTPTATTGNLNLSACYSTSAKKSGSTFDGRLAVGLLCKQATDVFLNEQVTTTDNTSAKPAIESKRLVVKGKTPNGVEIGTIATGGANKFYELQVAAICCPIK